tara:strand:+ start:174 stop:473 length:300 start_codon:yes stop_codon:yes gene_type:complete
MIKQEQKVIEYFIQNDNEPKHFEEVAEDLEILVPNVRRILGQGTLKGTFNRIAIGVYEFAHYETETETEKDKELLIVRLKEYNKLFNNIHLEQNNYNNI